MIDNQPQDRNRAAGNEKNLRRNFDGILYSSILRRISGVNLFKNSIIDHTSEKWNLAVCNEKDLRRFFKSHFAYLVSYHVTLHSPT
jgi:hypothetical protein